MSKFDEKTWRESRVTLPAQTPITQYFQDTKPNYILITNRNDTEIYLSQVPG
ncbi:putative cytoplasmic protein [Bacillus cereus]|nr:putative cytoplasmic protein [Bacillus cereus]